MLVHPLEFLAERRSRAAQGQPPLETRPASSPTLGFEALAAWDEVLPDYPGYVAWARAQAFRSIPIAPGVTFHGMALLTDPRLTDAIAVKFPTLESSITMLRQSPAGQIEPTYIHTDRDMGDWSAIYYLTEAPDPADGTVFWRHRATGATASTARTAEEFQREWQTWANPEEWEPWQMVQAKPNRVVVFPSTLFHARAIPDNYTTPQGPRLIQLVFGTGAWPCASR